MRNVYIVAMVYIVLLAAVPSAFSQVTTTWTVTNPVTNTEYQYSNIPVEVEYDWGTGTPATGISFDLRDPINGTLWGPNTNNIKVTYGPTWIKYKGTVSGTAIVGAGTKARLTFIAKDTNGNALGSTNVNIKLRPTP